MKKHLSTHSELYDEFQSKEKKTALKIQVEKNKNCTSETQTILQFLQPSIKVNIDSKTIINGCVELVTVNGRPYSIMDDSGFKKILNPVLNGLRKKITMNSNTIK